MGAEGFAAGRLKPCIKRHGEKAAEKTDQRHHQHHRISVALRQKPEHAVKRSEPLAVRQPHQQQTAGGQAARSDRYQPQMQPLVAEFGAQYRPGRNADGKQRQHQIEHIIVAAEMDLGESRKLGGIDRTDEPKPRNTDDGGKHLALRSGFTHQPRRASGDVRFNLRRRVFGGHGRHEQAGGRAQHGGQHH